jgi:hypothetical protein
VAPKVQLQAAAYQSPSARRAPRTHSGDAADAGAQPGEPRRRPRAPRPALGRELARTRRAASIGTSVTATTHRGEVAKVMTRISSRKSSAASPETSRKGSTETRLAPVPVTIEPVTSPAARARASRYACAASGGGRPPRRLAHARAGHVLEHHDRAVRRLAEPEREPAEREQVEREAAGAHHERA